MKKEKHLSKLTVEELQGQQRAVAEELARRAADSAGKELTLSEMELQVEDLIGAGRRPAIGAMLSRMKPERPTPKACPRCGERAPVKGRDRARTVTSLSGPVTIKRNYHYCASCEHGFYAMDEKLGLPEGGQISAELEKRVLDFAVNDVYGNVAERWSNHYRFSISDNLVRRVADRVGGMAESSEHIYIQQEAQAAPKEPAEILLVQNDGSMLCMRGRERWKEFKVAFIQRGKFIAEGDGYRFELIGKPRYVAEMSASDFEAALKAALQVEQAKRAGKVVWVADGAITNWTLAAKLAPGCIQLLDFQHAIQHGVALGKLLLGEGNPFVPLWQERIGFLLASGDVDEIVKELMECLIDAPGDSMTELDKLVGYYRSNQLRMRYHQARQFGLPIGSGHVESAHRHVLQTRMKRAGQLWSPPRARRLARLRAIYRTAGATNFHHAVYKAHRRTRAGPAAKAKPTSKSRASNR